MALEQLALYIEHHRHDTYSGPLFALFAGIALTIWHPLWAVGLWFVLATAAALGPLLVYRRFPGARAAPETAGSWAWRIGAAHAPHMLVWSSLVVWAWVPGDSENHIFILLINIGGIAATAAMSSPHRTVYYMDMALILPTMLRLLVEDGQLYYSLFALGTVFCILLFGIGLQINASIENMLRLRGDKERLIVELEHLAITDPLTGLANRRRFLEAAAEERTRALRYARPLSVLMIDADHFKQINDTWGHPAGDEVLVHIARLCRETARTTDLVARMGGEEFAILLPETDHAAAFALAERLRQLIAGAPVAYGGTRLAVTVSIGLTCASISDPDLDALMVRADRALYQAKREGRNRTTPL